MIKPCLRLFNVAAATLTPSHACVVIQYLWSICCVYLLQKMVVVFFLVFVGFENLATRDPEANFTVPDDEYVPTHSWMIRFAIATLAYILVGKSGLVSLVSILICKACLWSSNTARYNNDEAAYVSFLLFFHSLIIQNGV